MKEQIYTIPVSEAYDKECECPLCELEKKLENEGISYALGAAMMEPDYRVASNAKGYCKKHFSMMFDRPNKLSLALVLDTHLEEIRKSLAKLDKKAEALKNAGGGFLKKSPISAFAAEADKVMDGIEQGCMVCDKINFTMERYADVLLYMWANDENFRRKFDKSKGLCIPHSRLLLRMAEKSLGAKDASAFAAALWEKQSKELSRIQDDIHRFTLKFDYRNKDMEWGDSKDAPVRTIGKIAGDITPYDETEE